MLVFTRKPDQQVVVVLPDGREGRITFLDSRGERIRIGLEFPEDCKILRAEVLDRPQPSAA